MRTRTAMPQETERHPMPTNPHVVIQEIAADIRERITALNDLVSIQCDGIPAQAEIIAAQRALQHEVAQRLTVLDYLCSTIERARECAA